MATSEQSRSSVTGEQLRSSTDTNNNQNYLLKEYQLKERKENQDNLKNLLKEIYEKETKHQDDRDLNLQPSFSKFEVPYSIKCRNRYIASKKLYEERFQYEIEQLIAQQATGYEAARLTRHLAITTFWPPLHSQREITHTQRYFFSLTRKQRKRLNWIMNTNII